MQANTQLERFESRIVRGAVGGAFAGLVFLLGNMWFADSQGMPAVAPMLDISTIFHGQDMPVASPDNVVVGLVTHATLSVLFGVVFALLVPLLFNFPALVVGGVVYGLALYVVNFQIFGRTFFPWFTDPNGPDQGFEVLIHAVFGLVLVPFFIGLVPRRQERRVEVPVS